MFWGLIMEPRRRYSQVVKKAFHISMAALDISTSGDEPAQVMCGYEGRNYLLCTLKKGEIIQCPLDLSFDVGTEVSFATNGESHVHLTGYLMDEDQLFNEGEEEEEEEAEDEASDTEEAETPAKRGKKSSDKGPPKKKSKTEILLDSTLDSQDDSDDSDVNLSDLMEESGEEEEDDDIEEEEEDNEDDEDNDNEEWSSVSDEEKEPSKPKQNGIVSKKEKKDKKKNQQIESQVKDKKVKEKNKVSSDKENKVKGKKETPKKDVTKSPAKPGTPQKKTVEGGVIIEDIKVGNGAPAKSGSFLTVYYEGRLKNNNKVFDSSTKGPGFKFRLGKHEVIKGWDVGLTGMKVGGKRKITCPPHMAYGPKGSPPIVPPNSTLVFEVELKNSQ